MPGDNRKHHLFLGPYKEWYPNAELIGVEGLPEKKGIPFDHVIGTNNPGKAFGPEGEARILFVFSINQKIDTWYFPGHPNKEIAFLHKPSKTLIEADLVNQKVSHTLTNSCSTCLPTNNIKTLERVLLQDFLPIFSVSS